MNPYYILLFGLFFIGCNDVTTTVRYEDDFSNESEVITGSSIVILGTLQDAGSPHIGCKKECCSSLFKSPDPLRKVVSLGVVDPENQKTFLIEATPDISTQLKILKLYSGSENEFPDGIFLTHAHIGHYTGLMYLGKEASNTSEIPVYAMPRMKAFLETNGPWSQLVHDGNIVLHELSEGKEAGIESNVAIVPIIVPHRDEYSETVGYFIEGPSKKALFIPDIDKWEKWNTPLVEALSEVDYAFLDATFYDDAEINTRNISEIPHPFITETMTKLDALPASEKKKVYFIHFNHTNPVLSNNGDAFRDVISEGFNIAQIHDVIKL